MLREVTLRFQDIEKTYTIEADSHYLARVAALDRFLEEYKIPGRPVDYITGSRKGLIEMAVKSAVDRRTLGRGYEPEESFYTDQVEKLRRYVRESRLVPEDKKVEATKLLLELEEVLSS